MTDRNQNQDRPTDSGERDTRSTGHERTDGGTQANQPADRPVVDDDFEQRMDQDQGATPVRDPAQPRPDDSQDAMQPREAQRVEQGQQQPQQPPQSQQDARPPRGNEQRQQSGGPPQQSPQDHLKLDPWEIHDALMTAETRPATLSGDIEINGQERYAELQCTLHEPDWGLYQAVVGALPDELMDWMEEMADEYGNERDFEEIVQDEDVEPPRIIWDEKCVAQFRRILGGDSNHDPSLEHTPPEGRDKLTETPFRDVIYSMDPNRMLAGLAFAAIEMGANRNGLDNFRVE